MFDTFCGGRIRRLFASLANVSPSHVRSGHGRGGILADLGFSHHPPTDISFLSYPWALKNSPTRTMGTVFSFKARCR